MNKKTLPFDSFAKVLRPFMMGKHASEDIPEAFRLLDTDHSETIDIGELAAFMPVIVPDANPHMLLHHV
jgi:Ca2+-binding EF-hand superfamily protein